MALPPRPALACALLLAAPLLAGCLEPSPPDADAGSEDPKAAALSFSLSVVETMLAGDYARFRGMLAEKVYTLEGEGPYTLEQVDGWNAKERFPAGRDYSNFTMADYLDAYEPYVMTFDEVRERYPEVAQTRWDGWTPGGDDLVFVGNEAKEGKTSFMWEDLLAFAVTSETGEWRFKAFSG